ncbi:tyrosine-type recombinase/integrase [Thiocapsa rosea]|nr:tyrosine-type recombinase/integrase [Thiocapsa rosea]
MTIRSYIGAADRFMTWWADVSAGAALPGPDHACLAGYREHLSAAEHPGARTHERGNAYCGARRFLVFLQHTGIIPTMPPAGRPRQELEIRFCSWMLQHRGVCQSTLDGYARVVDRLLTAIGTKPRLYTAEQLRAFVLSQTQGWSHSKADTLNLELAEVERIIDACDPSTPLGARDHAIVLLLARLGLRAGDVAGLRLSDIDWIQGRIRVSGKSRRMTWLPLPGRRAQNDCLIPHPEEWHVCSATRPLRLS